MSFRLRPTERVAADGSDGVNRQRFANWIISSTAGEPAIAGQQKFPSVTKMRNLPERAESNRRLVRRVGTILEYRFRQPCVHDCAVWRKHPTLIPSREAEWKHDESFSKKPLC